VRLLYYQCQNQIQTKALSKLTTVIFKSNWVTIFRSSHYALLCHGPQRTRFCAVGEIKIQTGHNRCSIY